MKNICHNFYRKIIFNASALKGSQNKLFIIAIPFPTGIKAPEKMNFHKHIPNNPKLKLS